MWRYTENCWERSHEGHEQGREGGLQAWVEKLKDEGSQQLEQLDSARDSTVSIKARDKQSVNND
jgi:hypothetical protein